jgi:hypothetical protein
VHLFALPRRDISTIFALGTKDHPAIDGRNSIRNSQAGRVTARLLN